MGHDQVRLREPTSLPAGPAEIIAHIDGHEERWSVRIDDRDQVRKVIPIVVQPSA